MIPRISQLLVKLLSVLEDSLLLKIEIVCEMATLVVSSQQPKVLGTKNLPHVQQKHRLATKLAPIAIVSQKQVVDTTGIASNLLRKIIVRG